MQQFVFGCGVIHGQPLTPVDIFQRPQPQFAHVEKYVRVAGVFECSAKAWIVDVDTVQQLSGLSTAVGQ